MLLTVYSLLFRLALPLVLFRLWWSGRKNPALRAGWRQRLGYVAASSEPVIWVHAVSVGETIAAAARPIAAFSAAEALSDSSTLGSAARRLLRRTAPPCTLSNPPSPANAGSKARQGKARRARNNRDLFHFM